MSQNICIINTPIDSLLILKRNVFNDDRGYFFRLFSNDELNKTGLFNKQISQINFSCTNEKYTVRGFHFQYPPYTETKIVTCVNGEIFDIAIDLRKDSPTFLKWFGTILSEKNHLSMLIPDGFAHGFQSLSDFSKLIYLHSAPYSKQHEGGINIFDPMISVQFQYPPKNISERDSAFAKLDHNFKGITIL